MKLFGLYDKVAKHYISVTMSENEEVFIRTSLFAILMDYPIKDVELHFLGLFDNELGLIKPAAPRIIPWDSYRFTIAHQVKDKYLTIEQIEEAAKKKKNEFLVKTKDSIKDLERVLIDAKGQLHKEEHAEKKDKNKIKDLKAYIKQISKEIMNLKELA